MFEAALKKWEGAGKRMVWVEKGSKWLAWKKGTKIEKESGLGVRTFGAESRKQVWLLLLF